MITFDEFLEEYNDQVQEAYESNGMDEGAIDVVVSTMKRYLGNRRYDPMSLLNVFQSVCYSAMAKSHHNSREIKKRFAQEAENYLEDTNDYSNVISDNEAAMEERTRGM